jgi:hypothetical protein
MNPKQISIYKDLLDGLSQSDFERIKAVALSSRIRFRSLEVGELVCPVAEEVRERSLCSSCPLTGSCPNFII